MLLKRPLKNYLALNYRFFVSDTKSPSARNVYGISEANPYIVTKSLAPTPLPPPFVVKGQVFEPKSLSAHSKKLGLNKISFL